MRRTMLLPAALLASAGLVLTPARAADATAHGRLHSKAAVLRHGCHHHTYRYEVQAPSSNWYLNVRLIGPRGRLVTTDHPYETSARGRSFVQLCDYQRAGRYILRASGEWYDDYTGAAHPFPVRKATFAVRRP